jgi:hypothetical protein
MSSTRLVWGTLLLILALVLGGYGIWLIGTKDVQGGRDAAGGMWLTAATFAAAVGAFVLWTGRRRV